MTLTSRPHTFILTVDRASLMDRRTALQDDIDDYVHAFMRAGRDKHSMLFRPDGVICKCVTDFGAISCDE